MNYKGFLPIIYVVVQTVLVPEAGGDDSRSIVVLRGLICGLIGFAFIYIWVLALLTGEKVGFVLRKVIRLSGAIFCVVFVGLASGLYYGNPTSYLLGDMYKFMTPLTLLVVFGATIQFMEKNKVLNYLKTICLTIVLIQILDMSSLVVFRGMEGRAWGFSLMFVPWILISIFYLVSERELKKGEYVLFFLCILTMGVGVFLSGSRTLITLYILTFVLSFLCMKKLARRSWMGGVVIGIAFVFLAALIASEKMQERLAFNITRFSWLVGGEKVSQVEMEVGGTGVRVFEIVSLVNKFIDEPKAILFGFGFGGTYHSYVNGVLDLKHYVHNSYMDIVFRSGLAGLILTAFFFIGIYRCCSKRLEGHRLRFLRITMLTQLMFITAFNFLYENTLFYLMLAFFMNSSSRNSKVNGSVASVTAASVIQRGKSSNVSNQKCDLSNEGA